MYVVTTDEQTQPQVDALPADVVPHFAEVCATLEVAPWNGYPYNGRFPDAPVRTLVFGAERQGLVTYLIVEDLRRVDLLSINWLS